ncbi:MAG: prepilin-type N-terminal cleavage/methylation domain-containing protein [Zoogloea sp.]|nr:prepilin-type N-terminal cleavage/methylation domain-containing protein [Zoogloea sp.]
MTIPARRRIALAMRARGYTLVELMVSLVLGMVLVGGVFVVFMGSRASFSTTDNLSKMQDSARIAFILIDREIREASSTGCGNGSRSDNNIGKRNVSILNAAQATPPAWWSVLGLGIQGFGANIAMPAIAIGSLQGQRTGTTDAIQLAGAYGSGFSVEKHDSIKNEFTLNTSSHISANDILIACDYKQSSVFSASSAAANKVGYAPGSSSASNCSTLLGFDVGTTCTTTSYQYDALIARLSRFGASAWYVGNNASGRSSLYRIFMNGNPEEIAPGVTDMQIRYLPVGGGAYVNASDVADWGSIVAVRLTLSFESQDAGVSTASTGDRRLGTVASSTILLRNRLP